MLNEVQKRSETQTSAIATDNKANAKSGGALTTPLILDLTRFVAGALATHLTMLLSQDPKSNIGDTVFFHHNGRIKAGWVAGLRLEDDRDLPILLKSYELLSNGLSYLVPACEILTGWEPDFPTLDKIERSHLPEPDYEEFSDDALYETGFADEWQWWEDKDYLEELEREYASVSMTPTWRSRGEGVGRDNLPVAANRAKSD